MTGKQPVSVTAFQQQVYDAARRIPAGRVSTYARLARAIGCRSPRAVGQALRHNPFAPEVPCHRVIRSDLFIGGFAGQTAGPEVQRKIRILRDEGVEFDPRGRLIEPQRLFDFPC